MRYVIFWLFLWPSWAFPAELLGIRVGGHWGFSRLVFDFDRRVFYSMVPEEGRVRLSFLHAGYRGIGERRMRNRRVKRVSLTHMGETLLAVVYLRSRVTPRAYSIYEEGKFKVVVDLYDSLSTDLYISRGREYLKRGLYEDALAMFQGVLTLYPDHSGARLEVGRTLEVMGDYEGALQAFHEVPRSSPAWGEARAELAMLYRMLGRKDEERRCWKEVVDWVDERFGSAGDTLPNAKEVPKKGSGLPWWWAVMFGCAFLAGAGGGYGMYRALHRPEEDERPSEEVEGAEEPSDDRAELARRMAKRGEGREAISKKLGMSLREVELALKLKDR